MNQLNNPHMISDAQAKANSGKHYKTEFCVLNMMSLNLFAFNQYLQVICSFNLTCTLQQSMQRHHYIQTSCLCDSAWSCHHMYSYNMLTYTIYISP